MITIDTAALSEIMSTNRASLEAVSCWLSDSDYENSVFNYGLPRDVRHLLDAPIGDEVTYADVLAVLATGLEKRVSYLEIGVSAGKTFFQMLRFLKNAQLVGFEIEDMNPVLERFLEKGRRIEWLTATESLRKTASSLTDYEFAENKNRVRYVAGDVFDDNSWARLSGCKFNLVLSDAFHSGDALLREWRFIKALDLLDPSEFAMVWDDLGDSGMRAAFFQIAEEMRELYHIPADEVGIGLCRGWLGMNEGHHPVGIVRNSQATQRGLL